MIFVQLKVDDILLRSAVIAVICLYCDSFVGYRH